MPLLKPYPPPRRLERTPTPGAVTSGLSLLEPCVGAIELSLSGFDGRGFRFSRLYRSCLAGRKAFRTFRLAFCFLQLRFDLSNHCVCRGYSGLGFLNRRIGRNDGGFRLVDLALSRSHRCVTLLDSGLGRTDCSFKRRYIFTRLIQSNLGLVNSQEMTDAMPAIQPAAFTVNGNLGNFSWERLKIIIQRFGGWQCSKTKNDLWLRDVLA